MYMKRYFYKALIVALVVLNCPAFAQDFFDPDGYYFPEKEIVVEGYKLDLFELRTISYYNNGKLDYENPKFVGPDASLSLVRTKDEENSNYRFPNPIIGKSNVQLASVNTPIGIVRINGKFLDTRGMFWNLSDVVSMKTPVFVGTVSVTRNGKLVYEKVSRFTYWEGD
jgi:hypothetical protein